MRLIIPGLGATFTVVDVIPAASAEVSAATSSAEAAVDEAFGKPLSQLPHDAQQTLLENLPSSAGGLAVGPDSSQE
ncbi:hypothetical protein [Bradyrhizobium sp. SSUT77]|uniref:hypothetical protein n=1 Tax=Bradyrhizobium sp. SSUT77 TaxID=3040603 RepID=UPI002449D04D|nr:hypothetical protein [Bradyrhizobium sp. SSUT77]MDH2345517.1 hypothetical protein [Bradyrhizobium sp. SSUT77]